MLKSLSTLALLVALTLPCMALDFAPHPNDSPTENAIRATGSIVAEDAFRFQAYLSKLPEKKVTSVYLESGGGNIGGALALGRQIRRTGARTFAVDGKGCLSACVFVLVAGVDGETGQPFRVKGTTTALGVHHFTPVFDDKPSYTLKDLLLVEARAQKTALSLTLYFEEMGADLDLLANGLRQTEMYYLRNDEALPLGIDVMDAVTKDITYARDFNRRLKR
jgi:hypothetical protein